MADLWAMHLLGPDEIHPAPSFEEAERACVAINAFFKGHRMPPRAVVAPWRGTSEMHEAAIKTAWPSLWEPDVGKAVGHD